MSSFKCSKEIKVTERYKSYQDLAFICKTVCFQKGRKITLLLCKLNGFTRSLRICKITVLFKNIRRWTETVNCKIKRNNTQRWSCVVSEWPKTAGEEGRCSVLFLCYYHTTIQEILDVHFPENISPTKKQHIHVGFFCCIWLWEVFLVVLLLLLL